MPRNWFAHNKPSHSEPQDSSETNNRGASTGWPVARPWWSWSRGYIELPQSLIGLPIARVYKRPITKQAVASTKPPLNVSTEKTIDFAAASAHFEHPAYAARDLAGVVKVMKQFPQLRVTIQGNFGHRITSEGLRGFGPLARRDQDKRFAYPLKTRWPSGTERYYSIGQIMDSRAQTIRRYLMNQGIAPNRVKTARGQYMSRATVTIIFSN